MFLDGFMEENLFEHYHTLVNRVDERCRQMEASLAPHMACEKGCSSCCLNISLFPVEAIGLRLALDDLAQDRREAVLKRAAQAIPDEACPLLDGNGACELYAHRPIICRTHGLPILFEDEGGDRRVDFCPENFKDLDSLSSELMLDLEALNQMLAAVNAAFCDACFDGEAPFERLSIGETLGLEFS